MHPRVLLAVALAAALALGALLLVASEQRRAEAGSAALPSSGFAGATLPQGVRAPDFALRDQDGEEITMRELRGQPVVVTFLYTHCDETCPPQAQQIKGAFDQLGRDLPALAVAVDPPNDTPAAAREFLSKSRMTGRMDFVLGSEEELEPIWEGYYVQPQLPDEEHQARIVLVDRDGFQRVGFPLEQATPDRIAHDIEVLERE